MPHPAVEPAQRERLVIVAFPPQLRETDERRGAVASQRGETEHQPANDHRIAHPQ